MAKRAQRFEHFTLHQGFVGQAGGAFGDQPGDDQPVVGMAVRAAARKGRRLGQGESGVVQALLVQRALVLMEDWLPGLVDVGLQAGLMSQQVTQRHVSVASLHLLGQPGQQLTLRCVREGAGAVSPRQARCASTER